MKLCLYTLLTCTLAFIAPLQAQERTAGGTLDNQATWSTLRGLVDQANAKTDMVSAVVNKMKTCSSKGMLYAPDKGGDADSCIDSKIDPSLLGKRWYVAGSGGACSNCENGPPARWAANNGYGAGCGGTRGVVGRLCSSPDDKCHRIEGSQSCSSRGGDSSDYCTSSRWAVIYACE